MKLDFAEKKYYHLESHNGVEYAVANDGLVIIFETADIETILNKHYPAGAGVWYFNNTKDREIAERRDESSAIRKCFGDINKI